MTDPAVEEITRMAMDIWAKAKLSNGRFLLPRRFHLPDGLDKRSEIDRQYDACGMLCMDGHARWLDGQMAPGIELTGR